MAANLELQRVNEWNGLRGFTNLFRKENRAWWGTHRWWINAVLWPIILCGLMANILFVAGDLISQADFATTSDRIAYITQTGLSVFFEFGSSMLAIGIIVLTNGLIIGEKQNGVAEWLLSKPMSRKAYILSKLVANILAMLILLIGVPSIVAYGLLSLHQAGLYPLPPFLSAVGIMILHTFFYLTFNTDAGNPLQQSRSDTGDWIRIRAGWKFDSRLLQAADVRHTLDAAKGCLNNRQWSGGPGRDGYGSIGSHRAVECGFHPGSDSKVRENRVLTMLPGSTYRSI